MLALQPPPVPDLGAFDAPTIDWHGLAPEVTLVAVTVILFLVDMTLLERAKRLIPALTGIGLLVTLIPILTLSLDGADRILWDGAFVVDITRCQGSHSRKLTKLFRFFVQY